MPRLHHPAFIAAGSILVIIMLATLSLLSASNFALTQEERIERTRDPVLRNVLVQSYKRELGRFPGSALYAMSGKPTRGFLAKYDPELQVHHFH